MSFLADLTYADLREMTTPKLTLDSHRNALVPVVVITVLIAGYFVWLYYKEWQSKRKFRQYWEGKARREQK